MEDLPNSTKWWIALIVAGFSLLFYSPPIVHLLSGMFFYPTQSGAPNISIIIFMSIVYLLIIRLLFEIIPIQDLARWRYSAIITILAIVVYSPFLTSVLGAFIPVEAIFLIEWVIFLFLIRLIFF